jgi:hypothetical protein
MCVCGNPLCKCYSRGLSDGISIGYAAGFNSGVAVGSSIGYNNGFKDGYEYGFGVGYSVGERNGFNRGVAVGSYNSYLRGYDNGYRDCNVGLSYDPDRHEKAFINGVNFSRLNSSRYYGQKMAVISILKRKPYLLY